MTLQTTIRLRSIISGFTRRLGATLATAAGVSAVFSTMSAAALETTVTARAGTGISQPATVPADEAVRFQDADSLLSELETSDLGLESLQAEILFHRTFALEGDEQTRWGMVFFRRTSNPALEGSVIRQFAVRFDQFMVGRRVEERVQEFAFDGQWLAERTPGEKRFSKRQIVAPGESFDPLRVGEGPLPIPIGQRKSDILARFDAELVDSIDGLSDSDASDPKQADEWRKFVEGSYQLKLTPKAGSGESDFDEVRLWYKPADDASEGVKAGRLLPRMARTINGAGDVSTVQLVGVSLNFPIKPDTFDTRSPTERGEKGWDETVTPYRKSAAQTPTSDTNPVETTPPIKIETEVLPAEEPAAKKPGESAPKR